jgi:O-antigen ligase
MQKVARWAVLAPLFIIPFLVLYVSSSLYFPFIAGKGFAFRILIEIALAGFAVLALLDKKYRPQFSWTLVLYGALVLWMIVADAFAVSPLKAFWSNFERMDGWITLIHVFVFFLIAGTVLSVDKLWRTWWLTFLASSALVSLYGVFQLLGVFQIHQGGVRLDATLGNSEYLAAYLLFAIAVALWQAMESKGWLKYGLFCLAALHAIILFYTATRGAILGAIGAILLGAILWMVEAGKAGRRSAAIALVAVLVVIGGFYLARDSSFVQHDPTLERFASISLADGQTRFTIWHMAWEGFLARPVTGWGQEGFNYVFNTYYDPSLYAQEPWFDRAHNVFLDWLLAGGLPALLLFLALLGSAVVALYRTGVSRTERVLLISTLAAYAFQGLFVFDNLFTYIPLAAFFALAHQATARPWKQLDALPELTSAAAPAAGAVAAVAAAAVIWFVNVPNIAAGMDLIHALTPASSIATNLDYFKKAVADNSFAHQEVSEQLVNYAAGIAPQQSVSSADKAPLLTYAIQEINAEVAARPQDARIMLQAALAYRAAGDLPDALKEVQAALALSPNKQQILTEQALESWQLGDAKTAEASFARAYELSPDSDTAAGNAAVGKIIAGDVAGGKQVLLDRFGTTTVANSLLVYAYYGAKDYADLIPILELEYKTSPTTDNGFMLATGYTLVNRLTDARTLVNAIVAAHPEAAPQRDQFFAQFGIK